MVNMWSVHLAKLNGVVVVHSTLGMVWFTLENGKMTK